MSELDKLRSKVAELEKAMLAGRDNAERARHQPCGDIKYAEADMAKRCYNRALQKMDVLGLTGLGERSHAGDVHGDSEVDDTPG